MVIVKWSFDLKKCTSKYKNILLLWQLNLKLNEMETKKNETNCEHLQSCHGEQKNGTINGNRVTQYNTAN